MKKIKFECFKKYNILNLILPNGVVILTPFWQLRCQPSPSKSFSCTSIYKIISSLKFKN